MGVIGVFPPSVDRFPLAAATKQNLTVTLGNCNHRRYLPELVDPLASGLIEPRAFITNKAPAAAAPIARTIPRSRRRGVRQTSGRRT
ncbi:MAG: hypothetical protein M0004_02970 [Actinomycetota bacterium]|nr:hypothetical protein [Actinomycetota bacterium]